MKRIVDIKHLDTEKRILQHYADRGLPFPSVCQRLAGSNRPNPILEKAIGLYRPETARMLASADPGVNIEYLKNGNEPPTFLEAGPRRELLFDPTAVKAAIVTTGGLAPGLNSVVHSIVDRHYSTYGLNPERGSVLGVHDGFKGLVRIADRSETLHPSSTERWLREGGSNLGSVRDYRDESQGGLHGLASDISQALENAGIQILYIIGGDGSQRVAHVVAQSNPDVAILGIPKTMDNDVLWVWKSFGFDTAVAQATRAIDTLHFEAQSTRRIGILKFFGAESGFVVANATLGSGQVDLVLVPEVFLRMNQSQTDRYWRACLDHIRTRVRRPNKGAHGLIVVAEGVEQVLEAKEWRLDGRRVRSSSKGHRNGLLEILKSELGRMKDQRGDPLEVFTNEPRHYIRSVAANAHDQIYCERLGALAVDNALAGYSDCMISSWLTEYVLVPLDLVVRGKKSIPVEGMFWKQVENSTGQPNYPWDLKSKKRREEVAWPKAQDRAKGVPGNEESESGRSKENTCPRTAVGSPASASK